MNLRSVHAALIMLSAVLAVLVGIWCLGQYSREHSTTSLFFAIVSFAVSVGLIAYDSWFLRKTRSLR